jgi:hypothetical protein
MNMWFPPPPLLATGAYFQNYGIKPKVAKRRKESYWPHCPQQNEPVKKSDHHHKILATHRKFCQKPKIPYKPCKN